MRQLTSKPRYAVIPLACSFIGLRIWPSLKDGYPNDSFHTLAPAQAVGLAIVCIAAAIVFLLVSHWQSKLLQSRTNLRGVPFIIVDISIGVSLLWIALSAAPQLFYLYYQFIFDGLPTQWVIQPLLSPSKFASFWSLKQGSSVASHTTGALAWIVVLHKIIREKA